MRGMKLPTTMAANHTFAQVPSVNIQRSTFDRSFGHKTTFNVGILYPFFVDEALPGDTVNIQSTFLARLTTPLKPLMDNMYFETFYFAVPYRLVWSHFQAFMGEQEPNTFTSYTLPQFTAHQPAQETISDYMGIPTVNRLVGNIQFCSLWHRAYNLIYNQWFRDQNLIPSVTVDLGDGPDNIANYVLQRRGKRHDYFTSALPWPQKAAAAVALPLGTTAPVISTGTGKPSFKPFGGGDDRVNLMGKTNVLNPDVGTNSIAGVTAWGAGVAMAWDVPNLITDLTNATAATINQLRQAFQIQKFLERDARGGTRYTEKILVHFGVKSPDARLQRTEYLGGGSTPIIVNPIAQTTATGLTGGATPLANLAGIGTMQASGHGFSKSFTEHTLLIGIMNVRADLTYQDGLPKMFSRQTVYDLYWPEFAHLGEQTILNQELLMVGNAGDTNVFGYQERHAEYRYKPSMVTGKFRSSAVGHLDIWHLAESFGSVPTLGQTFIEDQTPVSRVVAVTTEPQFYLDSYHKYIMARPMPVYGVPGMIDHF